MRLGPPNSFWEKPGDFTQAQLSVLHKKREVPIQVYERDQVTPKVFGESEK